ncbi:MAG: deoxyribodipyrimidine photo-lyase [Gammaproteobacteria bacterium]|nr:deoxyribodipyrimidine photo-lyase [Gammaproteobacteria bacterium]
MKCHLVWFKNDLRVDDNPALHHACLSKDDRVCAVYLLAEEQWEQHGVGNNQQSLIIQAVKELQSRLESLNIPLIIRSVGDFKQSAKALKSIGEQLEATDLHFNVEYAVNERARDKQVVEALESSVKCHRYVADSLVAPWEVETKTGQPFKVFTPYSKACYAYLSSNPVDVFEVPSKRSGNKLKVTIESDSLPKIKPDADKLPAISEQAVKTRLTQFCNDCLSDYDQQRDFPAIDGTSQLSSALAIGTLSVRRCYLQAKTSTTKGAKVWISELLWRDFYRAVMWHFPRVGRGKGFLEVDSKIKWNTSSKDFESWKNGETGIPIVDAAMKQLNTTGWMHNRLRMIVASFLTKNLWIDWRKGEHYFAQKLFDFDYASNNGGWQWSASVGTDAAPYFRVFNPASQGLRFDEKSEFIKYWLPDLREKTAADIHKFENQSFKNYPKPMVNLKQSRQSAIEQFKHAKEQLS